MPQDTEQYKGVVDTDTAAQIDRKRRQLGSDGPITKSEATERALAQWADRPVWREQVLAATSHLALVALVVFIASHVSTLLAPAEGALLAWVFLAVAGAGMATVKLWTWRQAGSVDIWPLSAGGDPE